MKTGQFTASEGTLLFYRAWDEVPQANGKIVLLLHRGHEHSERLSGVADVLVQAGYAVYAFDNRGHGYSKTPPSYEFMQLVRDLDAFVQFVCEETNKTQGDLFIVANSVGGVVASTWAHDYAPSIAGMALLAPAFKIKLYIPLAKPALDLAIRFKPTLDIKSYVKSRFLTHNRAEQERYNNDKLINPSIPARQLTTLLDTAKRVVNDAHLIVTPTLVVSAAQDYVVDNGAQLQFYATLSSPLKQHLILNDFYHGILYEHGAEQVTSAMLAFMQQCFTYDQPAMRDTLVTLTQFESNQIAGNKTTIINKASYKLQRLMMQRLGFLSDGMQIGLKYGFDSGVALDHVYKNQPSGLGIIGQAIDKQYLNAIGWRGIRQRKVHLQQLLKEAILKLQVAGQEVNIVDIAGGPARYLVELAQALPDIHVQVRDYQEQNLSEGKTLAQTLKLTNIHYLQANAFDPASYQNQAFRPNIVIISGVFELFSDNSLVQKAIKGIAQWLQPNGYIIYTGQPWHPQLEQIAHVLGNHQKQRWIMRRRSQYELDSLFNEYGFHKKMMKIDDWGIFTVSLAQLSESESTS
ncbi:MAG: bifunctional alpha/beta hydrolase/class I SAM-dependent methyltransferase [Thiofilum sp.]|uniref:bifunctional alpha/beta hydrolase/class I SAM-dependent methyltransferase n=1 Tax=Thiofilum sp. TaxID=2212733 RepID=UPI0025E35BBD|nr:bifunctional alpha/beta hydrolase/class I SAM-dependent methyltransferase [Thiofilum sp.]MBK8455054.1 bifunctional alpha/beta hydrolase/class I SAM-dependent methyltransferase [Thiofilum sp.]